jgi:hypothetical protein
MTTIEKIKGDRIFKGMTILVDRVYTEKFYAMNYELVQFAMTPKKNKKTEALTILESKVEKSYNTGNGRAFTQSLICLETAEYGKVYVYSTNNFILA